MTANNPQDPNYQRQMLDQMLAAGPYENPNEKFIQDARELTELVYHGAPPAERRNAAAQFTAAFPNARNVQVLAQDAVTTSAARAGTFEQAMPAGWLSRYVGWCEQSEAPGVFHLGAALAFVAGSLERKPLLPWEARRTYPNMFVLLVGDTGARKGAAISKAKEFLVPLLDTPLLPGEGTPQGYAAALRRQYDKTQIANGLIVAPEYSVLMRRDKNKDALAQWLADWWDCEDTFSRALRGENDSTYELHNLYVSMLGGSNMTWLRTLPAEAISGGFMPRQLILQWDGTLNKMNPFPTYDESVERQLARDILHLNPQSGDVPPILHMSKEHREFIAHWYTYEHKQDYLRATNEQFRMYLMRKQAMVMKVAALLHLIDQPGKDTMELKCAQQALRLVSFCEQSVQDVYHNLGLTHEGEAGAAVENMLRQIGGNVSETLLVRKLRNRMRATDVRTALQGLQAAGLAAYSHGSSLVDPRTWRLTE